MHMKRILSLMLIVLLAFSVLYPITSASDTGITTERQTIEISSSEKGLLVEENIPANNSGNENATIIRFWIQQGAEDVKVLAVDSGVELTPLVSGNTRECNLTEYNLTLEPGDAFDIRLTYTLSNNPENFEKTLLYDTTSLSVTFNGRELYHGEHLSSDTSLNLLLYLPSEAPWNMMYIIIVFLLVILLIASTLIILRKQRSKVRSAIIESEELLKIKKALLLSSLKDIEKQHRSKTISDDTYTKLKDEYKQQAVNVMKKLEDIEK